MSDKLPIPGGSGGPGGPGGPGDQSSFIPVYGTAGVGEGSSQSGPNISSGMASPRAFRITRTSPDELLRHDISDEELGVLGEMKTDRLWDFMWAVFGIALGSAPSACEHISGLFHGTPIGAKGLAEVVITASCAAIFAVLYLAVYMRKRPACDLASSIRERTKHQVVG